MKKLLKQTISEYSMPNYLREMLINNYCPSFLKMTIIKEQNNYLFSYDTENYKKLDYSNYSLYEKLTMIQSVMEICKIADDYFVPYESFLIEPELVYSLNNRPTKDCIKLLFYPDKSNVEYPRKINMFLNKIKDPFNRQESETIDAIRLLVEREEWVKLDRYLFKIMTRLVN